MLAKDRFRILLRHAENIFVRVYSRYLSDDETVFAQILYDAVNLAFQEEVRIVQKHAVDDLRRARGQIASTSCDGRGKLTVKLAVVRAFRIVLWRGVQTKPK